MNLLLHSRSMTRDCASRETFVRSGTRHEDSEASTKAARCRAAPGPLGGADRRGGGELSLRICLAAPRTPQGALVLRQPDDELEGGTAAPAGVVAKRHVGR